MADLMTHHPEMVLVILAVFVAFIAVKFGKDA